MLLCSSQSDAEVSDQENDSADHVAAHMRHLQIAPPRTAFKPMQLPRYVIQPQSLPPKPKLRPHLIDPFSKIASGAAFKRQRDGLVAEMFKE